MISVGLRVGNLVNPSGKEKGAPGEGADHIRAQLLLPVHACDCVHAGVCVYVCACVCARAQPQGRWGARAAGFLAAGSGARVPGWADPGRAQTHATPALCVSVWLRAAAGTIFCSARDRHIKGKAAAARRRPLSLRCPLLQVYYYSIRAAPPLPAALASRRAMQRPGRLHAWLAPKPPPPPPYLSEKQPHVEAKKPAGATEAGPA